MCLLNDFNKMRSRNTLETREKSDADQEAQMSRNLVTMIIFKETFLTLPVIHAEDSTGKGCGITLQMIKNNNNNNNNGRKLKYNSL